MVMKTLQEARDNFENATTYIPERYRSGVMKADWQGPAGSEQAEKNFAAAMSEVTTKKLRQLGVRKASNTDWQNGCDTKGAPVIGERIKDALGKWEANFGPKYARVQNKVKALPPKGRDWRANINNRLIPVVEEWKK